MTDTAVTVDAAGYVRVSTEEQRREGYSLGEQRRAITERAEQEGWQLVELYADEGRSGRRADRPAYQRLLDDAAAGRFGVLVVWRFDRLGRDLEERVTAEAALLRAGVRIVSLTEAEIDEEDATAPLLRAIRAGMAEMESRQIGLRTSAALDAIARQGRQPTGQPPFGYRAVGSRRERRFVVDPPAAEIVRRIDAAYLAGQGTPKIAVELNADGVPTPTGRGRWRAELVKKILVNPTYAGRVNYRGRLYPGEHEPIRDADSWERMQALRAARAQTLASGRGRPACRHLLTNGLLRCGACGASMATRSPTNGHDVYLCRNRIEHECDAPSVRRELIDGELLRYFEQTALDAAGTVGAIDEEASRRIREATALADVAGADAAKAEERLARVRRHYQDGRLQPEDWAEQRDQLEGERDAALAEALQLRDQAAQLRAERDTLSCEAELAARLDGLRAAIAGQVSDADGLEALRAALLQTFEAFALHQLDGEVFVLPYLRVEAIANVDAIVPPNVFSEEELARIDQAIAAGACELDTGDEPCAPLVEARPVVLRKAPRENDPQRWTPSETARS